LKQLLDRGIFFHIIKNFAGGGPGGWQGPREPQGAREARHELFRKIIDILLMVQYTYKVKIWAVLA
jgi:hypothetical protein